MLKSKLLLGAALGALCLAPLAANAQQEGAGDITVSWDNSVDVDLTWELTVTKTLTIAGNIILNGRVESNALAQASLDDKQILDDQSVQFEDYQNANQNGTTSSTNTDPSATFGTLAEPGLGQTSSSPYYTEEGTPHGLANYNNDVSAASAISNGSGNIGLNLAAGDYNLQENAAVLSSAQAAQELVDADGTGPGTAMIIVQNGAAEAGSFSMQLTSDTDFNNDSYELENSDIDNHVELTGTLNNGTGNIGINLAAGAFNIQKNALVIATVTGGNLAEATAGVYQNAHENENVVEDEDNSVELGATLTNTSGNIGVNMASGVGNEQINTLTIANALLPAGALPPPSTNTGGGGGIVGGGGPGG